MRVLYSDVLGSYVFEGTKLIAKADFSLDQSIGFSREIAEGRTVAPEKELMQKYSAHKASQEEASQIREVMADKEHLQDLRRVNMKITADDLRHSVTADHIIIHTINNAEEVTRMANGLAKRLREWYGLHFPEINEKIEDNYGFVKAISRKDRKTLMDELKIAESIGSTMAKTELEPILELAETILDLYEQKRRLELYLEKAMKLNCRNLTVVAGSLIAAKLIRDAGSLQKLAKTTSTTIQMLGAEKALFRHLKNRAMKPPKHGHIVNHPIVLGASRPMKGKAARALADKLSIAAKVDYFKGEFIGDRLRQELEERF